MAFLLVILFTLFIYQIYKQFTQKIGQPAYGVKKSTNLPSKTKREPTVLVVGAGAAGLAVGACLREKEIPFVIVDKLESIGESWNKRYDRLHLHTSRDYSSLPFFPFPKVYPVFPSKNDVVEYLEAYSVLVGKENILLRHEVKDAEWDESNKSWNVKVSSENETKSFVVKHLVICTGENAAPKIPKFEGQEQYKGTIMHSSQYKNGEMFRGKNVLVVGFGNSGGELSIDLWEHDAKPTAIIRSPLNIVPRSLARITQEIADAYFGITKLPPSLRRGGTEKIIKYLYGDLSKYGITVPRTDSVYDSMIKDHTPPLIDIGQVDLIRRGEVKVVTSEILKFKEDGVIFKDGKEESYDAVILATGYQKVGSFSTFLNENIIKKITNSSGVVRSPIDAGHDNVYFNGYNDDIGRFHVMGVDAFRIVDHIISHSY